MARDINTDNVLRIMAALTEANASEARGLSIPELASNTGLTRYVIGRILDRAEYGFETARGRSDTGAVTYYHSVAKMTATVYSDVTGKIQPLQFEDEDKITLLVQNLLSALHIVDPANQLVSEFNRQGDKGKGDKDWFDWVFTEEDKHYLARKAKSDKKWQGKFLLENHKDNMALAAYNIKTYVDKLLITLRSTNYDPDALTKIGLYFMLAGLNPDEWKDKVVDEDVTKITPDED